ncbi:MAG: DUF1786 domain-containing protein [Chloroflexi bacterium]|nr:DUF1786 domain-containing protein [Chloroflexota bacterium]
MPFPTFLAIDIGTGTQDVYLLRAGLSPENGYKLVAPSPTLVIRDQIQRATRAREAILLTGVTMGGGPCAWAAEAHVRAGLRLCATPNAARTLNDDLEVVEHELGIRIVSDDEASRLQDVTRIQLRDFDWDALRAAFAAVGHDLRPSAVGVAVFDHGAAPPGVSDRQFRFDYLEARIRQANRLSAFAYRAGEVPASLTRLQAIVDSADILDAPLVVMDTAPAAVLGALLDPGVSRQLRQMVVNIGNFHTLAFRLGPRGIEGVFEHHTGLLTQQRLETYLSAFADGSLMHQDVFGDRGHGALVLDPTPLPLDSIDGRPVVTGPRRSLLQGSSLQPCFAAPFGDMMLTGCFGLLQAMSELLPEATQAIRSSLAHEAHDRAPWDAED